MNFIGFTIAFFSTLVGCTIFVPVFLAFTRMFGLYTIVNEGSCKVYMLFGKVVAVLNEPACIFFSPNLGRRPSSSTFSASVMNWICASTRRICAASR